MAGLAGIELDDFGSYFARQVAWETLGDQVTPEQIEYRSAPDELRQLFMADLILSDQLERLTTDFSWRLGALAADEGTAREESEANVAAQRKAFFKRTNLSESDLPDWLSSLRRDKAWLEQMLQMEAEFQQRQNVVLTPQTRQREMNLLRLPLTRFEAEVIEVESRDAAQEALFCVKQDGMSMEEVAAEGRYPFKVISFLQEDIPADLQQKFLSVLPGDVLEPIARGDGYELYRVTQKREPQADDEAARQRIDHLLLWRHFSELTSRHIQNRLFMNVAKE